MLYPIKFIPILKPRIWGGNKIANMYNQSTTEPIGESWEICDREHDNSIVANGFLQGKSFKEIKLKYKEALLGTNINYNKPFPILVKLLDATSDLSIQVHPKKSDLFNFNNAQSKSEFWYILNNKPNASIIAGLKNINNKNELLNTLQNKTITNYLNYFNTNPHSLYYIKSGTPHAILQNNFILEVQENSDTTFRMFDYDRLENNIPRQLHIKESIKCINPTNKQSIFVKHNVNKITSTILNNNLFMVKSYNIDKPKIINTSKKLCKIISVTSGNIVIKTKQLQELILNEYNSALLPANLQYTIVPMDNNATFLITSSNIR